MGENNMKNQYDSSDIEDLCRSIEAIHVATINYIGNRTIAAGEEESYLDIGTYHILEAVVNDCKRKLRKIEKQMFPDRESVIEGLTY